MGRTFWARTVRLGAGVLVLAVVVWTGAACDGSRARTVVRTKVGISAIDVQGDRLTWFTSGGSDCASRGFVRNLNSGPIVSLSRPDRCGSATRVVLAGRRVGWLYADIGGNNSRLFLGGSSAGSRRWRQLFHETYERGG